MRQPFTSRAKNTTGRTDLWIILGITIVLIVAVVVVLLRLLDQSEKHVETVKDMKMGYSETTWNPATRECEISLEREVNANPNRTEATFEQLNLSEKGIKQIARLRKLEVVNFTGSTFKDSWLKHLEKLPLKHLNLTATDITNNGLESVARMKKLQELILEELPSMNDESIRILKPLQKLKKLHLKGAKITARGIKELAAFPLLSDLHISDVDANDDFLSSLSDLEGLKELTLKQSTLSLAGCSKLAKMKTLSKLFLDGCNIDDSHAAALSQIPNVFQIALSSNPLSDKGLAEFEKCKSLAFINVNECKNITDKGLVHFHHAKPNCNITHVFGQAEFNKSIMNE